jgi:hypothetical protein
VVVSEMREWRGGETSREKFVGDDKKWDYIY